MHQSSTKRYSAQASPQGSWYLLHLLHLHHLHHLHHLLHHFHLLYLLHRLHLLHLHNLHHLHQSSTKRSSAELPLKGVGIAGKGPFTAHLSLRPFIPHLFIPSPLIPHPSNHNREHIFIFTNIFIYKFIYPSLPKPQYPSITTQRPYNLPIYLLTETNPTTTCGVFMHKLYSIFILHNLKYNLYLHFMVDIQAISLERYTANNDQKAILCHVSSQCGQ